MNRQVEIKHYRKIVPTPMIPWTPDIGMAGVSVSAYDFANGHPLPGDMVAWAEGTPDDRWLVSKEYFETQYEHATPSEDVKALAEAVRALPWRVRQDGKDLDHCDWCDRTQEFPEESHDDDCLRERSRRILQKGGE